VYNETQEVGEMLKPVNQIAIGNNSGLMEASTKDKDDSLEFWYEVYFTHAVTTSQASRHSMPDNLK
jgi:hypothetical protein